MRVALKVASILPSSVSWNLNAVWISPGVSIVSLALSIAVAYLRVRCDLLPAVFPQ